MAATGPERWTQLGRVARGGRGGALAAWADFLTRDRPLAARVGILATALAVATGLRALAGTITEGVPLAFYVPAILIVTLTAGWRLGLVCVFAGGLLAWYLFVPPAIGFTPLALPEAAALIIWFAISALQVLIAEVLRMALKRARLSEARSRRLLDAASGLIWVTDAHGHLDAPHADWSELTGMAWPDYAALGWMNAIHPEDRFKLTPSKPRDPDTLNEIEFRLWSAAHADWRWYHARAVSVPSGGGAGIEWITAMREIHDQKLARDRRDLVIGELRHRLKNLVTVIEALAKNSRERGDPAVEGFLQKFLGRLRALGAAGDLVLAGNRVAIECGAVVRAALTPFMDENSARIRVDGPLLQLSEETGGSLALAVHELATNALKYGALSKPSGRVSVVWRIARGSEADRVSIEWSETGGPAPAPPEKEGFGTRVIRTVCAREKNGDVRLEYRPEGLYCRIAFDKIPEGPPMVAAVIA